MCIECEPELLEGVRVRSESALPELEAALLRGLDAVGEESLRLPSDVENHPSLSADTKRRARETHRRGVDLRIRLRAALALRAIGTPAALRRLEAGIGAKQPDGFSKLWKAAGADVNSKTRR
jgi:hypothetical protein